jgi:antitoxin component YwqK of YwqJK toxin-antitoxin module
MNKTVIKIPKNTFFTTALSEDFDYRPEDAAWLYEGVPFTGIAYDYDTKTGKLTDETSYWNGGIHGFVKLWYPGGQVKLECRYFAGDFSGDLKEWYESGQLKRHGVYWGSEYPLRRKQWDEQGNLIEDYHIEDDESNFSYYIVRKKHKKSTLPLRKNWASIRRTGLIDFNKRIQLYLREHPFTAIEPKKR